MKMIQGIDKFAESIKLKLKSLQSPMSPVIKSRVPSFDRVAAHVPNSSDIMAVSLLIIATAVVGLVLYWLASILVPFFLAVFLMYLFQPIVNLLTKSPRRLFNKCCQRRGESCFQSCFTITQSRVPIFEDEVEPSLNACKSEVNTKRSLSPPIIKKSLPSRTLPANDSFTSDEATYGSLAHQLGMRNRLYNSSSFTEESLNDVEQGCCKEGRPFSCLDRPLLPRVVAVFLTFVFVFFLVGCLCFVVQQSLIHLQTKLPLYQVGADQLGAQMEALAKYLHFDLDQYIANLRAQLATFIPTILGLLAKELGYLFFVCIFLIYLLMSPVKPAPNNVWGEVDLHVRRWIRLKTIICISVGLLTALILTILQVDLAMVFGLLAFVFNFVPNIGPTIATLLPMVIVILDPNLPVLNKVLAFVLPTVMHLIIGSFAEPMLMGESLQIAPVCVLLSLAFWFILWGIPGVLMAVPLMSMIRIVCVHLNHPYSRVIVLVLEGRIIEAYSFTQDLMPERSRSASISPRPQLEEMSSSLSKTEMASSTPFSSDEIIRGLNYPSEKFTNV